ncbi:hypothetical protein [Xenorhabdus sp. TH1]|uniref:hypothetical protein n=1 Tax=Xenorhabdus sp. TH1 TaxID=3130166 RepID=UPI0030D21C28
MKIKTYVNISLCLFLLISGKTLSFPDNLPSISPADQEIIKQKQKDILEESQKQQDLGLDIKVDKPK